MERAVTRAPVSRRIVERFIAGAARPQVLEVVSELLASDRVVSVDFLGEDTTDRAAADSTVTEYLALITALGARTANERGVMPTEVSVKLSALGAALPTDGPKIALENAWKICTQAQESSVWVTVDAEDHTTTDTTLGIVRELRSQFPWLGTVLQAYLRRAEDDCRELSGPGSRIRLCKGAYAEPESVAFTDRAEVDDSYRRCLGVLMRGGGYPMVASHDPSMIAEAGRLARETRRKSTDFEHQMLYGIRDIEQTRLADAGHTMRVYVPYGSQWYGYFMRRLAERPSNLRFFVRSLATRS
ncbi:proline dehydrogenase family protein [Aldersonia sp. NBC_00410]|uniref:proline dehydrogenase family protein n=1 Tax=Aldersonia sp. NBC_00410 TaxID=2975954 RepID=UPI00225220EA|nr:proline dehydrogenase family protein [Aldersonia sp. NBC_00410]MCX5043780.1 proline dehydrogenase family protein [Aldersonia sp. NBC_00410]